MNTEVLANGYTVIYKNDRLVLACKVGSPGYQSYTGNKMEYASWKFGFNNGTHHGHYNFTLPAAMEDFEERNKKEGIHLDHNKFQECIENHRMEVM